MPTISVIVPVYKVESYLHRCVDSILAQSFTDFELILVDDGSPDNCRKICDEYAEKDSRIHVIHQENGGLSAARNAGIDWAFENSDSEWISFIDSDDWVHPCFLKYLYRAVKECNIEVSACGFERVTDVVSYSEPNYHVDIQAWDQFYIADSVAGAVAWNKIYAKGLFQKLRYPVGKFHEDEFLTYQLLYQANRVAVFNVSLYFYFQNEAGIMKRPFSLKRLDSLEAIEGQCRFAKKIKNVDFYNNRTTAYFRHLRSYLFTVERSELSPEEKAQANKEIISRMRRLLLREGKKDAPFRKYRWCYELAFPKLNWLYWTGIGIIGKIKRMVKRSADN